MPDDVVAPHRWSVREEAQIAMLLAEARRLVVEGDPELAAGLAEELLDLDPENLEALEVIVEAAPRYDLPEVGVLAAHQARRLGAPVSAAEAAAHYAAGELQEALDKAEACIALSPNDARAWAVCGQVLELRGDLSGADAALDRAHQLRPEAYPLPFPEPTPAAWTKVLTAARTKMSPGTRKEIATWVVAYQPSPTPAQLAASDPPAFPQVPAITTFLPKGNVKITLFTRTLLRGCATRAELVTRLNEVLLGAWELIPKATVRGVTRLLRP